jgi:formylglycine-generating enzyme required for sulfatase activity
VSAWEWCLDGEKTPDGKFGQYIHGGCWRYDGPGCRAQLRHVHEGSYRFDNLGLRIARVPFSGDKK